MKTYFVTITSWRGTFSVGKIRAKTKGKAIKIAKARVARQDDPDTWTFYAERI